MKKINTEAKQCQVSSSQNELINLFDSIQVTDRAGLDKAIV